MSLKFNHKKASCHKHHKLICSSNNKRFIIDSLNILNKNGSVIKFTCEIIIVNNETT